MSALWIDASYYFNPRSRVGNDIISDVSDAFRCINFNPRSRVGNDLCKGCQQILLADFNPRSRVGNDDFRNGSKYVLNISIHVPAWGTTAIITNNQFAFLWKTTKFHIFSIHILSFPYQLLLNNHILSLFPGANPLSFLCSLTIRTYTIKSKFDQLESPCQRLHALPLSDTYYQGSKNASCLLLHL